MDLIQQAQIKTKLLQRNTISGILSLGTFMITDEMKYYVPESRWGLSEEFREDLRKTIDELEKEK